MEVVGMVVRLGNEILRIVVAGIVGNQVTFGRPAPMVRGWLCVQPVGMKKVPETGS